MTLNKKFLTMTTIVQVAYLLLSFIIHDPLTIHSSNKATVIDTIPQTEIYNVKRTDVYVVYMDTNIVKIHLKIRDSIIMTRTSFDTLPLNVKKEISANNDGIFKNEEVESTYPGGASRWMNYLNRTFKYPSDAERDGIQGTVVAQFIVDDQGNVSDIRAVSGPTTGGLREETIRIIKGSGKWNPGIWNGYKVTTYKRQPLTFKLTP